MHDNDDEDEDDSLTCPIEVISYIYSSHGSTLRYRYYLFQMLVDI